MSNNKTIQFRVITVTRKASAEVSTVHYTYEGEERKSSRTEGAEWEEIEFVVENEEQPTIQIANIAGNALLIGQPKLIVNNPELFGLYKVGDIIEFIPVKEVSSAN
jgi:hypothetical protein